MLTIFRKAAKPSNVLDRGDEAPLKKLSEALKQFLWQRRASFIEANQDEPLLEWYGADTTPLRTTERVVHQVRCTAARPSKCPCVCMHTAVSMGARAHARTHMRAHKRALMRALMRRPHA